MHFVNDWIDVGRCFVLIISCWCALVLVCRWKKHNKTWTEKTKDYWYALFMWSIVGIFSMIQGVLLDRPLTPVTVAIAAAVLVTGRGLHRKGSWGGTDA